jgi:hypothetical protein
MADGLGPRVMSTFLGRDRQRNSLVLVTQGAAPGLVLAGLYLGRRQGRLLTQGSW